ncbi:MAG: hypothetical protein JWP75_330 [Frondihabitans sp.]|nr:hypothetical protein [Frondihabitans sp.]
MDPRQARTKANLRDAIYALAEEGPVDDISVADAARRAGISRETFYKWSAGPVDLLATVLGEELDEVVASHSNLPVSSGSDATVYDEATHDLLLHVARHAAVYRNAMSPRLNAALRHVLTSHIESSLTERLTLHPQLAPMIRGKRPSPAAVGMLIAYGAAGAVGTIEAWLTDGDPDDTGEAEAAILAAAAPWWLGRGEA